MVFGRSSCHSSWWWCMDVVEILKLRRLLIYLELLVMMHGVWIVKLRGLLVALELLVMMHGSGAVAVCLDAAWMS
ncbi:hypothetical protein GOP47_0013986 [Adiantum capillus-veneris]|uniref:Uncharacterized protein n=1 Tax=Adiantum capillus-veneris TaxID=13818 RepID=A0A9D4UPV0_ADICA|nr:hypothetical protein GOP47_0013986 [Adiantum capillus-veneris]